MVLIFAGLRSTITVCKRPPWRVSPAVLVDSQDPQPVRPGGILRQQGLSRGEDRSVDDVHDDWALQHGVVIAEPTAGEGQTEAVENKFSRVEILQMGRTRTSVLGGP